MAPETIVTGYSSSKSQDVWMKLKDGDVVLSEEQSILLAFIQSTIIKRILAHRHSLEDADKVHGSVYQEELVDLLSKIAHPARVWVAYNTESEIQTTDNERCAKAFYTFLLEAHILDSDEAPHLEKLFPEESSPATYH